MYYGLLVMFGVGLLILEVIVVEFIGCIFVGDLGLWDDVIEVVLDSVLFDVCVWFFICIGI